MFNKHNETKQRFTIKKYSFGAASVLIGIFFAGATAQASEAKPATEQSAVVTPAANKVAEAITAPAVNQAPAPATTSAPAATTTAPAVTETKPAEEAAPKTRTRRSVDTEQQPPVAEAAPTAASVDSANDQNVNGLIVNATGEVKDTDPRTGNISEDPVANITMDIEIPVGKYKAGDTLDIKFENLFTGVALSPVLQLKSTNQEYIYGTLKAVRGTVEQDSLVAVNTEKVTAETAASSNRTTLDDKLAANIPFKGATTVYTYVFNSNVEALENMRLYFEVQNAALALPPVSKEKSLTGRVYVDGVEVLELPYSKAPETSIDGTSGPFTVSNWGTIYLNPNKTINRMETTVGLTMGENALPTGGTFDVTLNDTEFSKFVSTGPTTPFAIAATQYPMVANQNDVYLNTTGGLAPKVQVVSVTDNKVTFKVVEGELAAKTAYNFYLQGNNPDKGARRIFSTDTQALLKAAIEKGERSIASPAEAAIAATGLTAADGTPSIDNTGNVGWAIRYPANGFSTGDERQHTAELLLRIVTEDTGAEIFGPTPIVDTTEGILSGTVINRDRFSSSAPTANTTIVTEADIKNIKPTPTEAGGVTTLDVTAPYIVKGTDGKLYQFVSYAKDSQFTPTKTADVLRPETANLVAQYKELAFGRVDVRYLDTRGNELRPTARTSYRGYNQNNPNFDHVVGKDYDVTGEAPVTTRPEVIEKDGFTYLLVKEPTNLKGQLSADTIFAEYFYDVAQKANITFTKQEDKSNLGTVAEQGLATKAISPAQYAAKLKELVAQGYEVVTDGFGTSAGTTVVETTDKTFDNDAAKDQAFEVVLKERVIDVTNPNDPNLPQEIKDKLEKLAEQVTQTIEYKYEDGSKAADTDTTTVDFTRTAKVNLVTKEVTYTPWITTLKFDAVPSPAIEGYTPDKAEIAETPVLAEDTDEQHKHVVTYKADDQKANIVFKKEGATDALATVPETGKSATSISSTAYAAKLAELLAQGYEKVSDNFETADKTYDKDAKVDQNFEVVLKEKVITVTDPNDPQLPQDVKDKLEALKEEVNQEVKYVKSTDGSEAAPTVTDKVEFTRTATVNLATKEVTYSDWTPVNADKTFDAKKSPVVTGFVADKAEIATKDVTATDADDKQVVTYKPVGKYIVEEPGKPASETPYANDPQDPTKLDPNGKPNVPFVEGYTPKDENGNDLPPVDPNDPTKGYVAPPVPTDPGKDTPIRYVANDQKAIITFEKEDGTVLSTLNEAGKSEGAISEDAYKAELAKYKKQGYAVVSDTFDGANLDHKFDTKSDEQAATQTFKVVLKERIIPLKPDAQPGQPVDPNDPEGPVWPDNIKDVLAKEEVVRTISYVNEKGETVAPNAEQKLGYHRPAILNLVNLVTTVITEGDWAADTTDSFTAVKSPVVEGYLADRAEVPAVVGVKGDADDITEVVTYRPVGKYIIEFPEKPTLEVPYKNDPKDPTQVDENNKPNVPYEPGYTPVDPNGRPLLPVDPQDPTKGYEAPPAPESGQPDTPIRYVIDKQTANIVFIKDGKTDATVTEKGDSATNIPTTAYETKLEDYIKQGYTVTTDEFAAGDKKFDKDSTKDQEFKVVLVPLVVPVTPDAKPGQPVDPNNPNGPKWPAGVDQLVTKEVVNQTVTYVKEDGTEAAPTVTDKVEFTRDAEVNLVTGEVKYGNWTAVNNDTTFDVKKSPVVTGYLADKAEVAAKSGLTATDADVEEKVTYKPVGKYIIEEPGKPASETPYVNDPQDPTKLDPNGKPNVPFVEGYTPKDENGNDLPPVDPNDPTKGYVAPPVPTNPGQDTPIRYVADEQTANIVFVKDGNKDATVTEKGQSGTGISTTAYEAKLAEYLAAGYTVVTDNFKDADKTFDKDKNVDQNFEVVLVPLVVPVTPGAKPGQPVDPNNPNGPKWPAGVDQLVTKEVVNQTVKYVKSTDGSEAAPTVTDKVEFTREAKVNLVTGEVTYTEWTAVNNDTTFDAKKSPVVTGFLADKAEVAAKSGLTATDADVEEVVTYSPIGEFVIELPDGSVVVVPYPNDPTDPTKPGVPTTVVPYVPGFVPVGPDGNPLTPVDPNDPTKGYVPPTPTNPGEDTPITYVPNVVTEVPSDFPTVELPTLEIPVEPAKPTTKPAAPAKKVAKAGVLPKTSATTETNSALPAGLAAALAAAGLMAARRRKEEDK